MEEGSKLEISNSEAKISKDQDIKSQGRECFNDNNVTKLPLTLSSISRMLSIDGNSRKKQCIDRDAYNPKLAVSLDSATFASNMSQKHHKSVTETKHMHNSTSSIITRQRDFSNSHISIYQNASPLLVSCEGSQSEEFSSSSPETVKLNSLTSLECLEDGFQEYARRNESIGLMKYQSFIDSGNFDNVQDQNENEISKEKTTKKQDDDATVDSPHESRISFLESEDQHVDFLKRFGTTALSREENGTTTQQSGNELSNMERGGECYGMTPFHEIEDQEDSKRKDSNNDLHSTMDTYQMLDDEAVVSPVSALQQLTSLKTNCHNDLMESINDLDYGYFCHAQRERSHINDVSQIPSHRNKHQWNSIVRGLILVAMLFAPLCYHTLVTCGHYQLYASKFLVPTHTVGFQKDVSSFTHKFLKPSYNMPVSANFTTEKNVCIDEEIPSQFETNAGSDLGKNLPPNTTELVISNDFVKNATRLLQIKEVEMQDQINQQESFSRLLKKEKTTHSFVKLRLWKVLCFPVSFPVYSLTRILFLLIKLLLSKPLKSHFQYNRNNELDLDFFLIST